MQLGTAKRCITPTMPLRLCGFAFRNGNYEKVVHDIYLRAYFFKTDRCKALFLYADVIAWSNDTVQEVRATLYEQFGLLKEEIILTASHNHSGPPTGSSLTRSIETPCPAYTAFLLEQIIATVKLASENFEDISIFRHDGLCRLNVYRRFPEGKGAKMMPNYDIAANKQLTVITFCRKDGTVKGLLANYACHANLSSDNVLQPDYPGYALEKLDEHYNCISIFLQGFTGDLRPNSVLGNTFKRCNAAETEQVAIQFFEACVELLQNNGQQLSACLKSISTTTKLLLENSLSPFEVNQKLVCGTPLEKDWAEKVIDKGFKNYESLGCTAVQLADGLIILIANAEVSQFYCNYAQGIEKSILCAGYTDGIIGYLCSEEQIINGGYEPAESAVYFALNGTYPKTIEQTICNAIQIIINKIKELQND